MFNWTLRRSHSLVAFTSLHRTQGCFPLSHLSNVHPPTLCRNCSPRLSILEPCPTHRNSSGPMALTLHKLNTRCTTRRRPISLGLFSVRCRMVRRLVFLFIRRAHFVRSVPGCRDCHRSVLSIHGHVTQSCRSYKGYQVAACDPQHDHVLVCNDLCCTVPGPFVHFLHRRPGVLWWRRATAWASWVPARHFLNSDQRRPPHHVPLE